MYHKFKKIFSGWGTAGMDKGKAGLADIVKHTEGLSEKQRFLAKTKILKDIENIQKNTGKDKFKEMDLKKALTHLWKPKIISRPEADNILTLAKDGRLPKQEKMPTVEKEISSFESKRGALESEARPKLYESKIKYESKIIAKKRNLAALQAEISEKRKEAHDNRFNEGKKVSGEVKQENNRFAASNKEHSEVISDSRHEANYPGHGQGASYNESRRESLSSASRRTTENARPVSEFNK